MLEIILGILAVFLFLLWKDNYGPGCSRRPPSPIRLPIIGNLHQIAMIGSDLPFVALDALAKEYGPIMNVKIGMKETVVVSSFDDMSALLSRDDCQGRFLDSFIADRSFGREIGLIFSNGEMWKTIRRFTIRNLREFGFGKTTNMETVMIEELKDLIANTKQKASQNKGVIRIELFFNLSLLNIVWTMVAGKRYSHDDPKLKYLMDINERGFKSGTFGADLSIAFPLLRHVFPGPTGATTMKLLFKELHQFCRDIFNEHRLTGDYKTNPQSFVDAFLNQMDEEAKTTNPSERIFTEEQFIVILIDLFQTGSESLGCTLSYAILFMILNPNVQNKVQEEISKVVPLGTEVQFMHRSMMPYTQATIMEVLRMGVIVPIAPSRRVTKDFIYNGYQFKKGLPIMSNWYSVCRNEAFWDDPEEFRPERFIDSDGKLFNTERMAPFGFGKRFCMGEPLATEAIFMYFTTMLKYFEFKKVSGQLDPTTKPAPAFLLGPQPFDVMIKVREQNI